MMPKMLEVKALSARLGQKQVLEDLSFSLEEGRWLMIAGPNGAGKSTAVKAMTRGVDYQGSILFEGEDIRKKKSAELARCMGVLAQSNPVSYSFTVEEVVSLGRYSHTPGLFSSDRRRAGKAKKEAQEKKISDEQNGETQDRNTPERDMVEYALELTGMASRRRQSVLTLSGGELQRTFLAQALAQDPKLLILDEPTNHLDLLYQKQVFELIGEWLKTPGRAVISVTHDLSLAKAYGTEVLLMDQGRKAAWGRAEEVLTAETLKRVYRMDVYDWMRKMLSQWM